MSGGGSTPPNSLKKNLNLGDEKLGRKVGSLRQLNTAPPSVQQRAEKQTKRLKRRGTEKAKSPHKHHPYSRVSESRTSKCVGARARMPASLHRQRGCYMAPTTAGATPPARRNAQALAEARQAGVAADHDDIAQ